MLYNAYSQKLSGSSRSRKDPVSYLNIMVVGSAGLGKTAFVRTFCETLKQDVIQGSYRESKFMVLNEPLRTTRELYTVSMHIQERGRRTALTLIDTPGFTSGSAIEHQLKYISKYIDYQFERTLAEESKVKRDAKALDTHIHSCLFFIDIKSINGLSEADRYILKKLSSRVNVVPVIGKSDTLSVAQCEQLKAVFRREVFDILQIPVYGYIEVEDEDDNEPFPKQGTRSPNRNNILNMLQECVQEDRDEDAAAMIEYLDSMPFTLINYEEDLQTGRPININLPKSSKMSIQDELFLSDDISDKKKKSIKQNNSGVVLGRAYPWAIVECCNPNHCDFQKLKDILLTGHRDMLRIDTFERYYEHYRTEQLLKRKISRTMAIKSKQGMPLV
ncbi:Septin-domain-containing protein [Helicostylum pulchrum]|uniref:Septin-type G domain-containing protein n=1 Tax=Helicostylum pulchrum TaxID=562976 RepID=A0ABP9XRX4_9FUNG|nr:Septin-domain-containing protein [Helicostylum pulchrum]